MSRSDGGRTEASTDLPAPAALAAERAALPDPKRTFVVGFGAGRSGTGMEEGSGGDEGRVGALASLSEAWAERRHVIVRFGDRLSASGTARSLCDAGVSAGTPALLAAELGTGRERLLYGSLDDVRRSGFGVGAVLLVPHPAVLPMDFAWPPTAAPKEERIG